jgi:hypothetical protein
MTPETLFDARVAFLRQINLGSIPLPYTRRKHEPPWLLS